MKFFPVIRNALLAPAAAVCVVRCGCAIAGRSAALLLFLLVSAAQPAIAQSQTVVIDCLPPWEANNRFGSETLIKHPSLSLNGFDCGSNCDIGYGLKQVLEKTYGADTEQEVIRVFGNIVNLANKPFQAPESSDQVRKNTEKLQARGFVALAAYVLDNNDYDPTTLIPALPSATQAVDSFRTALRRTSIWKMEESIDDDGVKWATPLTNVARAMDFYLALENAYKHYDSREYNNESILQRGLLSPSDKIHLRASYLAFMIALESRKQEERFLFFEISRYHAEPGNAPLKMQVALGYAALTWQSNQRGIGIGSNTIVIRNYISRSFTAAGAEAGNDRLRYWRYQSDDGKFFWAEGPYYFHLTLSQIIPFWHAARINGFLQDTDLHSHQFSDPFRHTNWFLNPLHWLADISTPDGKMPPLDDGHKHIIYNSGVLAWRNVYGNNDIGEKYAQIAGRVKSSLSASLYPVEIAIPRRPLPDSGPPDGIFGNYFDYDRTDGESGRQEVVLRRTVENRQHYVLLNGESGDATVRGEGHEQGDQMQLLYYVDGASYLIDSGYDRPLTEVDRTGIIPSTSWYRSTWNNYTDHNVMILESDSALVNHGGIGPSQLSILQQRIVSPRHDVNEIYRENHGSIDLLSGNIILKLKSHDGLRLITADYYRNVLFINDSSYPYIIDINAISRNSSLPSLFKMYYHGNSDDTSILPTASNPSTFEALRWDNIHKSNDKSPPGDTDNQLFIQPFSVEDTLYFHEQEDTIRESYVNLDRGSGINIKRMELHNTDSTKPDSLYYFTTVAFIRALPNGIGKSNLAQKGISSSGQGNRSWQYFTWMRDNNTVDVVVSRSSEDYADPSWSSDDLLYFPIPEAHSFYVELPANLNYGFVRLKRENGIWDIDPSFQLNLEKSLLSAWISAGPDCLVDRAEGEFVATARGGKPPYSYLWSRYRLCDGPRSDRGCNIWMDDVGTTQRVDYGRFGNDNFKIRVKVTDSSAPQQSVTSDELEVRVLASTESCSSNTNGSVDPEDEEVFASDADLFEAEEDIPEAYALRQNFPNPFNPSTEILFDLPEDAMVSLVVYDVLGREVARLVQRELHAGTHRARFNAGNLPSGVYFYRIQAGDFHSTHRMTLLK